MKYKFLSMLKRSSISLVLLLSIVFASCSYSDSQPNKHSSEITNELSGSDTESSVGYSYVYQIKEINNQYYMVFDDYSYPSRPMKEAIVYDDASTLLKKIKNQDLGSYTNIIKKWEKDENGVKIFNVDAMYEPEIPNATIEYVSWYKGDEYKYGFYFGESSYNQDSILTPYTHEAFLEHYRNEYEKDSYLFENYFPIYFPYHCSPEAELLKTEQSEYRNSTVTYYTYTDTYNDPVVNAICRYNIADGERTLYVEEQTYKWGIPIEIVTKDYPGRFSIYVIHIYCDDGDQSFIARFEWGEEPPTEEWIKSLKLKLVE